MHSFSTHSDEQLVGLLQQGDEPAFAEIYQRYWKPLYLSAHNILQVKEPAQDVVQEVFISLWKRRDEVQIASLKSYLFQAVRFRVFRALRDERSGQDFLKRLSWVTKEILCDEPILFKELDELYRNVLNSLPADELAIFKMHREQGLTYKQIAEQQDISVKTVEKKMSGALRKLRDGLDEPLMIMFLFILNR